MLQWPNVAACHDDGVDDDNDADDNKDADNDGDNFKDFKC